MKYIFLRLRDRHGEYEWYSDAVHELDDSQDIHEFADEQAKLQWAEDDYDEEEDDEWNKKLASPIPGFNDKVYFSPSGDVATKVISVREISKEHFEILSQYI